MFHPLLLETEDGLSFYDFAGPCMQVYSKQWQDLIERGHQKSPKNADMVSFSIILGLLLLGAVFLRPAQAFQTRNSEA